MLPLKDFEPHPLKSVQNSNYNLFFYKKRNNRFAWASRFLKISVFEPDFFLIFFLIFMNFSEKFS